MSGASDWSAVGPISDLAVCKEAGQGNMWLQSSFNDSPYALVTLPRAVLTSLRSFRNSVLNSFLAKSKSLFSKLPFLIIANNNIETLD